VHLGFSKLCGVHCKSVICLRYDLYEKERKEDVERHLAHDMGQMLNFWYALHMVFLSMRDSSPGQ